MSFARLGFALRARVLLAGCLFAVGPLRAQELGEIRGQVTLLGAGSPLGGVSVIVQGIGLVTTTRPDGSFRIERVPAGSQMLLVRWLGFRAQEFEVTVPPGGTVVRDVALEPLAVTLDEVTISASRLAERIVEAPAAVAVIEERDVRVAAVTGQLPRMLTSVPGVDLVQNGVSDFNVNARGFNSSLNRRVLVLQDGRDLATSFLGSQEWLANAPPEDVVHVEMVKGPGSALYGANAFSGVLSITTPSAREVQGTRVAMSGGELGTFRATARHAGVFSQGRFGYKVLGGYTRSDTWSRSRTRPDRADWEAEYAQASEEPLVPPAFGFEVRPLRGQSVDAQGNATGDPDPIETAYGTARLDYYTPFGAVAVLEGGASHAQNELYITGAGRVQVYEVLRPWLRAAWQGGQYNVMAWYSGRNTLEPQHGLASDGPGLEEKSALAHLEGQYFRGFAAERGRIVLGASVRDYGVNTEGTLMAPQDDDRHDAYYSGYAQVEFSPHPQWRLVGAARWDKGDLFEGRISPKAAVVFSPTDDHALRLTFNQAFQTPNYSERFLYGVISEEAGPRGLETSLEGLFQQLNGGPLGPAVADLQLPNDLPWNFGVLTPVLALGNSALEVEEVTGYELGYKGTFSSRGYLTVDAYLSRLRNFVTDLLPGVNPAYPTYQLDAAVDVPSKLAALDARIQQLEVGGVIPPAQAAAIRAGIQQLGAGYGALDASLGPFLATLDGSTGQRAGVVSYGNAGRVEERGLEIGAGYYLSNFVRLDGSYSFFDFDVKAALPGDDLVPNTPKHKGSISASYLAASGLEATASFRFVDAYHWAAGVFAGPVPGSQSLDVNFGYQFSNHLRLHLIGSNLLDQKRYSLYGGSVNGRRLLGGLTATF